MVLDRGRDLSIAVGSVPRPKTLLVYRHGVGLKLCFHKEASKSCRLHSKIFLVNLLVTVS